MKKIINNIKGNYGLVLIVLTIGFFIGWIVFHPTKTDSEYSTHIEGHEGHEHATEDPTTWTCSMHPQIKQDQPGQCPICAMDLIPLTTNQTSGEDIDPDEIVLTEAAAQLANIQTLVVTKGNPKRTVHLQGKVHADERNIAELTARFGGRIEKLHVNFTGQRVQKGGRLATVYSPDLVTAQSELLEAMSFIESRPSFYTAARTKLKLWDLTEQQINEIEDKGEPQLYFDILSPITGTVMMRHASLGDYVKEGDALFQVTDLSRVWVMFDAYESDLSWISKGDHVELNIQSASGESFQSSVSYIDPFINSLTRVAKVRVELPNLDGALKPEMFANGILHSQLSEAQDRLLIPKSSILWTGKRAVVYVKVPDRESPSFLYREITLGPEAGNFYVVADGLKEGEVIAVNGVFKIDAAAQLEGKPSMMNPEGGKVSTGHDHGQQHMDGPDHGAHETTEFPSAEHASFKVAGNCGMCKDRIEAAARTVPGILSAHWDAESQEIHLDFESGVSLDAVHDVIAAAGHDTELRKAPDEVYRELPGCCLYDRLNYGMEMKDPNEHIMVKVAGNCEMCKERIEKAALSVDGVEKAEWIAETQQLHLAYNSSKTSSDQIQKVIADSGHDTEDFKAPDEVYDALPGCCLYVRIHN